jgi:long-subunit fatty acid transport protein
LSARKAVTLLVVAAAAVLPARPADAQDVPGAVRDPAALGVSVGAGARALGMGGAFIAVADDGTAASWNPAGIAVLERPEMSVVWKARDHQRYDRAPFTFRSTFAGGSNLFVENADSVVESLTSRTFDFVSAAYPLRLGRVHLVPQLSYQRAIDQGHRTETLKPLTSLNQIFITGSGEEGRDFGADESRETETSGRQRGGLDVWTASVGARPLATLFVGASLNWWSNGSVGEQVGHRRRARCLYDPARNVNEACVEELEDAAVNSQSRFGGFNVNVGVLWKVGPRIRVGAVYKTPFDMNYDELQSTSAELVSAERSFDAEGRESSRTTTKSQSTTTVTQLGRIRWPRTLGVGVAFNPRPELTLSSDFTTSAWSGTVWTRTSSTQSMSSHPFRPSLSEIVFSGSVRWPTSLPLKDAPDFELLRVSLRDQRDTYQGRLGAEYVLTRRKFVVPLRGGGFVDRQYFSDGRGRPVHAWGWTAGAGLVYSHLAVDVAYVWQSTRYSLDLDFTTAEDGGRVDQQRSVRSDHIGADRVYVSAIVRF